METKVIQDEFFGTKYKENRTISNKNKKEESMFYWELQEIAVFQNENVIIIIPINIESLEFFNSIPT